MRTAGVPQGRFSRFSVPQAYHGRTAAYRSVPQAYHRGALLRVLDIHRTTFSSICFLISAVALAVALAWASSRLLPHQVANFLYIRDAWTVLCPH